MQETGIIRVSGTGELRFPPDITRLSISLEACLPEYADCLRRSSEDTDELKAVFRKLGFPEDALKTRNFNVDIEYEGYSDEHGNYRQRFKGYRYSHQFVTEFDSDNELLGRLLYALSKTAADPVFRISYTVRDPEEKQKELLRLAVRDAKMKAELLAKEAGAEILAVSEINYGSASNEFGVQPVRMAKAAGVFMEAEEDASFDMDIVPEDIRTRETVELVFRIGKGEV